MLSYNRPNTLQSYQSTEINTANRLKVLIMLYEGAVRFTKRAIEAINEGKIAVKGEMISKTLAIVGELQSTLDHSHAPELASNLDRLYTFIQDRLKEGNVNNDAAALEDALKIIKVLHSAWVELSKKSNAELAVNGQKPVAKEETKKANASNYFQISV
ncbi:MAG TPA: flagellar export chaperone FliS [bacterium]|nr:flagellar export chaperone FliS [bacterium]